MRNSHETDSSISQFLEILKNYHNDGKKHRQSSDFSFESKKQFSQTSDLNFTSFILTDRHQQNFLLKEKINSSTQKIPNLKRINHSLNQTKKMQTSSVFKKLFQQVNMLKVENLDLKKRRERLFEEGKKKTIELEVNKCTFSPNLTYTSKSKQSKGCSENQAQQFYKKEIDWQNKLIETNRIKKCQKNQQQLHQYTFTPQTFLAKSHSRGKQNKQNSCLKNKGVSKHLDRQAKVRKAQQLLKARWATVRPNENNIKPFIY